jgi:hypothetical protein
MTCRLAVLGSALIAGLLATGCGGGSTDVGTTPTSPGSLGDTGSNPDGTRPPSPPRPAPPPASGSCTASQAEWAVGQTASADLLERARVDAGAGVARFIRPNQPMTTEYSGARVNLYLDGKDVVQSVVCG